LASCSLPRWRALVFSALVFLFALGGCASNGNPRDPFEPINRGIYKFNDHADHLIIRPAAELYRGMVPEIVRTGVSNFFSNVNDVVIALNNLLQGKITESAMDVARIVLNTTIGLLGVIDVATEMGAEKHNEDFGQTLGRWGFASGPYLVLPFIGPSSVRDGIGLLGDLKADPMTYVDPVRTRNQVYGLFFLSRRTELLETSRLLETAALDPYEFLRDAYLQRRHNLVHDGNPPAEDDSEAGKKPDRGDGAGERSQPAAANGEKDPDAPQAAVADARPLEPDAQATPQSARKSRMVRLWLPGMRN